MCLPPAGSAFLDNLDTEQDTWLDGAAYCSALEPLLRLAARETEPYSAPGLTEPVRCATHLCPVLLHLLAAHWRADMLENSFD